jgi:hypothetical protein
METAMTWTPAQAAQQALAWFDVLRLSVERGDSPAELVKHIGTAEREVRTMLAGEPFADDDTP